MSRPALELYAELYATGSLQGAFSHVYPDMVKGLPIPMLRKAPGDAPRDWFSRFAGQASGERFSRAGVRRAFGSDRDQIAAVLSAAAERRQQLEFARGRRRNDFLDFMQIHSVGWRWKRGDSLEVAPDETAFLQTLGEDLISLSTMNAVRGEFRRATSAAKQDAAEAKVLQAMLDALAASLYSTKT